MQVEHKKCMDIKLSPFQDLTIHRWMDSWSDGRKENHPCFLQDIGPLDLLRKKIILYKCMYRRCTSRGAAKTWLQTTARITKSEMTLSTILNV